MDKNNKNMVQKISHHKTPAKRWRTREKSLEYWIPTGRFPHLAGLWLIVEAIKCKILHLATYSGIKWMYSKALAPAVTPRTAEPNKTESDAKER